MGENGQDVGTAMLKVKFPLSVYVVLCINVIIHDTDTVTNLITIYR